MPNRSPFLIGAAAASMLLAACSWTDFVRREAIQDLRCPEEQIVVEDVPSPGAYVARGCGRTASYYCASPNNAPHCWRR